MIVVRSRNSTALIPTAVAAVVALSVAGGLVAAALGADLGDPAPPFLVHWDPRLSLAAIPGVMVVGASLICAVRLADATVSPRTFALAAFGVGLAARLGLAVLRDGLPGLYAPFGAAAEGQREYLPALSAFANGVHSFLDRFAETAPSFPVHPSAHPPGLLLTLHELGITGAPGMAALTITAGAVGIPLTYVLARALVTEQHARVAALLFALSSSALLYGATSADALYASLGVAAAAALVRPGAARLGGGVLLAIASFFSYALLGVGAWAVVVVGSREGVATAAWTAVAAGGALAVFYGALYLLSGYDPIGALAAAGDVYRIGIANARPYAYWLFGSPAAFLVAMGLPLAWHASRGLAARRPEAIALFGVIAASAAIGFTKAETERIWLFYVPLACIAAAAVLPAPRVKLLLILLVVQATVVEVLLNTIW